MPNNSFTTSSTASSSLKRPNPSVLDYENEQDLVRALQCALDLKKCSSEEPASSSDTNPPGVASPPGWLLPTFDPNTTHSQSVAGETQRLQALKSFHVLDSSTNDPSFDALTKQAATDLNVAWACVSLVDLGRQWFKSLHNHDSLEACQVLTITETPRKDSFCAQTVQQKERLLVVLDATQDERFRDSALVTASPSLRFYAGVPLRSPEDGASLGAFCIFDSRPRTSWTEAETAKLERYAAETVQLLVQHKAWTEQTLRKRSGSFSAHSCPVSAPTSHTPPIRKKKSRTDLKSLNNLPLLSLAASTHLSTAEETFQIHPVVTIPKPEATVLLPDPATQDVDPDRYLIQLVEAMYGVTVSIQSATKLGDKHYFVPVTEEQISAYNMDIVNIVRNNQVAELQQFFSEHGRDSLCCCNRFGEGLLNMSCRRGFTELVEFLLSPAVHLDVRVSDDYGRTPMHDACWNPEPQVEICGWLLQLDPSLFLVADKRGYTPFQYARKSDWHIWRQFLFDRRHDLAGLLQPDTLKLFS